MRTRSLAALLTALAVALVVNRPAGADDKQPHEGMVVKAADGKLTMTFKGQTEQHTHDVAKDAKVTLDGKPARLEDLKEGYHIKVTMNDKHTITRIDAHSRQP